MKLYKNGPDFLVGFSCSILLEDHEGVKHLHQLMKQITKETIRSLTTKTMYCNCTCNCTW